jgi:hypothetical protein
MLQSDFFIRAMNAFPLFGEIDKFDGFILNLNSKLHSSNSRLDNSLFWAPQALHLRCLPNSNYHSSNNRSDSYLPSERQNANWTMDCNNCRWSNNRLDNFLVSEEALLAGYRQKHPA